MTSTYFNYEPIESVLILEGDFKQVIKRDDAWVKDIRYHMPRGEGDCHYCDIFKTDGEVVRIFRPAGVKWHNEASNEVSNS